MLNSMILQLFAGPVHFCEKAIRVRMLERIPNIILPVSPKNIIPMNISSNLLMQLKRPLLEKIAVPVILVVGAGSTAHKLIPVENPANAITARLLQVEMFLMVVGGSGMNELPDRLMSGVERVNPVTLRAEDHGMLNNPMRKAALSDLGEHVPMGLEMRAINPLLGLVRPMRNDLLLIPLGDQWSVANRATTIDNVGVVEMPDSFAFVVVDHGGSENSLANSIY